MKKTLKIIEKQIISSLMFVSPELAVRYLFLTRQKKWLSLKNPKNFNEKIQWLKFNVYNSSPLVVQCADKYRVREYVANCGLENNLNEIYGIYNKPEDIPWDDLPQRFVLKTTHGSGGNIICKDKSSLNLSEVNTLLNKWLNTDYGKLSAELYYSKIEPKIIAEKYLEDKQNALPIDYKIYCFNGKPQLILVISDRGKKIKLDFVNLNWEKVVITKPQYLSDRMPDKPDNLDDIVKYAEVLSSPFPFVRVDFYNIDNKPVFGEMTFTPAAGAATYYIDYGLEYLGNLLNLEEFIK